MENEFVPYELALQLKELGFDKECIGFYENGITIFQINSYQENSLIMNCTMPIFSQAFSFFREKFELISTIHPYQELTSFEWYYNFSIVEYAKDTIYGDLHKLSYKEAELACLNKLIEISK